MVLEDSLRELLAEHGERACILLKAIYEESRVSSGFKLGDFSVKGVKSRLKSWGVEYNPVPLLLKLEKELGVIETSYRSTTQRWWRVVNMRIIEDALKACGLRVDRSPSDHRVRLLKLQFHALKPGDILRNLRKLESKSALTKSDMEFIRRVAFKELPLLLKLKEEAEKLGYSNDLQNEINLIEELMEVMEKLILRDGEEPGYTVTYDVEVSEELESEPTNKY